MPLHELRITRRAADRIRVGHLWVYASDVTSSLADIPGGALVTVADGRGQALGTGLFSAASQIAVRLVTDSTGLDRAGFLALVRERVLDALALRRRIAPVTADTNAHRLIFSEADLLPGIIADRYNDLVLLQLLTQSTAQQDVRDLLADTLRTALSPAGEPLTVLERPDPRIRELEQLEAPPTAPLVATQEPKTTTTFRLNGLNFSYDAAAGQKTGAFLDQRLNYAAAAAHVQAAAIAGPCLDVCTYQGGFALHLAHAGAQVTGIDQSRSALEAAERNLLLNPALQGKIDWMEADAFEYLRHLDSTNAGPYAAIVLDPPAFAKSRRAAEGAARGYKELNLRALKLLATGGTLITNSCSHHVPLETFTEIVSAAAADAGRRVQILEVRAAAPDHPEILTLPETRYLKCLICRVL